MFSIIGKKTLNIRTKYLLRKSNFNISRIKVFLSLRLSIVFSHKKPSKGFFIR